MIDGSGVVECTESRLLGAASEKHKEFIVLKQKEFMVFKQKEFIILKHKEFIVFKQKVSMVFKHKEFMVFSCTISNRAGRDRRPVRI